MNRWPTREEVERIRARFRAGMRVEVIHMGDPHALPAGTRGTIICTDDAGDLIVEWDNGSGLNLIPDVDDFRILPDESRDGGEA